MHNLRTEGGFDPPNLLCIHGPRIQLVEKYKKHIYFSIFMHSREWQRFYEFKLHWTQFINNLTTYHNSTQLSCTGNKIKPQAIKGQLNKNFISVFAWYRPMWLSKAQIIIFVFALKRTKTSTQAAAFCSKRSYTLTVTPLT